MLRKIRNFFMIVAFLFLMATYIDGTHPTLMKTAIVFAACVFFLAFIIGDES